jgi:hypothetical protein
LGDGPSLNPGATADRRTTRPGLDQRGVQARGYAEAETKQFLQHIGLHPAATRRSRKTSPPITLEDWAWQQEQREAVGTIKDRLYRDFIAMFDDARKSLVSRLRTNAALAPVAGPCDELLGVIYTVIFTVMGMAVGIVDIVVTIIPNLARLVFGVIRLLGAAVVGVSEKGERGRAARVTVNETLSNLLPAVERHVLDWIVRFHRARTEMQSIMIGELCAEVFALLAPGVAAANAARAGSIAVRIPVFEFEATEVGALKLLAVSETTYPIAPSVAAATAVAGSTSLMAAGKSSGSGPAQSQTKPKPGSVLRKEPTLKDAGWGPRPPGAYNNPKAEAYATKVTGSKESLYVGKKWTEFDGYRTAKELGLVDFPGYRPSDRFLLDAKYGEEGGYYDLTVRNAYKESRIVDEVIRQGTAWADSGAAGIAWIVSNERVAISLIKFFKERQFHIKVIYRAP